MQFEVIRKSHKKEVVIGVVAIILIAVVLLVRNSFAKYQTVKNLKIVEGTINYTVPDFKIMGIYYQKEGSSCTENSCYEEKEIMPESGYKINTEKSYCTTDNINKVYNKVFTNEEGKHVITGLSKDSKCYIYFDKEAKASDTILAGITVKESPDSFTGVATSDEGVFKTQDDDGNTYYFRGAVTNNYVKFADKFWRIIRINGDETIRLIYQGTSATSNGQLDSTSAFNSSYNNNMYVGFKYTSGDVHGTGENSTILGQLNSWYTTNLAKEGIRDKIDPNAGFCGDRTPYTDRSGTTSGGGTGTTETYYGAYLRMTKSSGVWNTTQTPTFKCKYSSDLFTKSGATKGNKALEYPIGLITADEVVYAGGFGGTANSSYYLYTGQAYWTLSPCYYYSSVNYAYVFFVHSDGTLLYSNVLYGWGVFSTYGVRPVINLKADTKFTYNNESTKGTASDPYVVK